MFLMAAYFKGVAHPPGYPLYTLISNIFAHIPGISVASGVHALSGIFGAAGCVVLWLITFLLTHQRYTAYIAAFALGFSEIFWSQSMIAEVYTLNVLLNLLMIFLAILAVRSSSHTKRLYTLAFVTGLSLSNHWPLTILTGVGVFIILAPQWPKLLVKLPQLLIGVSLGVLPYLWLVLRSQDNPEISFLGPIESLKDSWYFVSRKVYGDVDQPDYTGWSDKLGYLLFFTKLLGTQFSMLGLPLIMVGAYLQFKRLPPTVCLGLITIFVTNSLLLIALLGFENSPLYHSVFRVYPLTAFAVASFWLALACSELIGRIEPIAKRTKLLATLVVIVILSANFNKNFRHDYVWTDAFAAAYLSTIPQNGILFADGDIESAVLGYQILVEEQRPDIQLMSSEGRIFNSRLFNPLQTLPEIAQGRVDRFLAETQSPLYYTGSFIDHPYGIKKHWLTYEIDKSSIDSRLFLTDITPLLAYLDFILRHPVSNDQWTEFHRSLLLKNVVPHLTQHIYLRPHNTEFYREILKRVISNYSAKLMWAIELVERYPDGEPPLFISQLLQELVDNSHEAITAQEGSTAHLITGIHFHRRGQLEEAQEMFKRSTERWPSKANPAWDYGE